MSKIVDISIADKRVLLYIHLFMLTIVIYPYIKQMVALYGKHLGLRQIITSQII